MFRTHHQVGIQRACSCRIGLLVVKLLQECGRDTKARLRIYGLKSLSQSRECSECRWRKRGNALRLVGGWWPAESLSCAPYRDGGAQRIHWMGVGREQSKCRENRWGNLLRGELCVRVPLAGQQEIKNVRVVPLGHDLFNRIPAIQESTCRPVDVANGGLGTNDAGETWAEWLLGDLLVAHRRGRRSTNSSASRRITEPSSATKTEPVKPPGSP